MHYLQNCGQFRNRVQRKQKEIVFTKKSHKMEVLQLQKKRENFDNELYLTEIKLICYKYNTELVSTLRILMYLIKHMMYYSVFYQL